MQSPSPLRYLWLASFLGSVVSACSVETSSSTAIDPTTSPDPAAPAPIVVRSGAARLTKDVGYGTTDGKHVSVRAVVSTSADLCGAVPATQDAITVALEILLADNVVRPQALVHAQNGVRPGAFRGWVHRVASDCRVETGALGAPSVAFAEGASLEIVAVDGDELTLRLRFESRSGTFDGTATTRACTSRYMHLDPFEDDDRLPGCAVK